MNKLVCGARLRIVRNTMKLSQKAFGELIEVNQVSLSQYERGRNFPPLDVLVRISKLANVSVDWLCGLEDQHGKDGELKHYTLYKIYYGDRLVYLGRTAQPLNKRLYGHFSKAPMMRQLDAGKVTKIEYAEFKTEADMFLYEIYFINLWKPELNKDDKSKQLLTIELPPVLFSEYVCDLLPKWQQIAAKKDALRSRQAEEKENLRRMFDEKRRQLKVDETLSEEQRIEKLWEWREAVYEPMKEQIERKQWDDSCDLDELDILI